jgi:hypothetical protein
MVADSCPRRLANGAARVAGGAGPMAPFRNAQPE